MAATTSQKSVQAVPTKKIMSSKLKKARSKPKHPRTSDMVNGAIGHLKERNGSSLQAIKKYIAFTYKIDADKHAPFIKRYLKTAVVSGTLVQTKGKGAAGSFKLVSTKIDSSKIKTQHKKKAIELKKGSHKKPSRKPTTKKPTAVIKKVSPEKRKISKGPAAKPPKPKSTKLISSITSIKTTPKKTLKRLKSKAKKPLYKKKPSAAKKK
ncbi:histone H1-like [Prorops nasuta]|uniref:histone H1-like n=1 Tax=Prorops nasuta TaxID=863751 RepID=UPI0034CD5B1C